MALLTGRGGAAGRLLTAALAAAVLCSRGSSGQTAPAPALEVQVKAAFLYNFAKFVDWPTSVSLTKDNVFVIGVLGDSPVFAALNALEGSEVKGRRLVVRRFSRAGDAVCHVLFVPGSQTSVFSEDAARIKDLPMLTVGEEDAFLKAGGMITLVQDAGRIRYRVRPHQADAAHLVISSKLLKLADRISE